MEINRAMAQKISSIRYSLGIEALKKSLGQDAQSISVLLQAFRSTNAKVMESSVSPHKGRNIDISI